MSATILKVSSVDVNKPVKQGNIRSLAASIVGNLLEWYDWTIYTVTSIYIAASMFDKNDPTSALLNTLAVFAVGFVSRPIGGFFFGPLAEKIGRRKVMIITMLLMASASFVIGLLPSFSSIGYWASALLVLARLVQGFAHGGETATSYAYIAEIAPPKRRGLWSSSAFFAVGAGSLSATLAAAVVSSFVTEAQMYEWGWRILFVAGGLLAIFAMFLRKNMIETHNVEDQTFAQQPHWPLPKLMKAGFKLFFYEAGSTLSYYSWVTCIAIYAITTQGMDPHKAFMASCGAQIIYLMFLPLQGLLSDYIGAKYNTLITYIGSALTVFPLWNMVTDDPWTLFTSQTIGLLIIGFLLSCKPGAMSEQIPSRYRTRMFGFFMSLAVTVFGGTASYLNAMTYSINAGWLFNVYLIVVCITASCVVLTWKNNKGIDLNDVQ